jgi:hypothetical protein
MNKIQNKILYKNFKKFVKKSLELLNRKSSTERVELGIKEDIRFHDIRYQILYKTEPELFLIVRKYREELESLEETDACIKIMLEEGILQEPKLVDSEGNPIETPTKEQTKPFLAMDLIHFIERLVDTTKSFEFDEQKFNELYQKYEGYWYADVLEYYELIPLFNFESEVEEIELNGIKINKFTDEEKKEIWKLRTFSYLSSHELADLKFKLVIPYEIKKGSSHTHKSALEIAEKVITALRLFKAGVVYFTETYSFPITFSPHTGISSSLSLDHAIRPRGDKFNLKKNEVKNCIKFWHEFREIILKENQGLNIAIRKFNDSYNRLKLEDKIIDLTIGFESTILHGIKEELSYRLRLRTALLLGENFDERKRISKTMKELYDRRSEIVHQGKNLPPTLKIYGEEHTAKDFVSTIEDFLRRTIKKYGRRISQGESMEDINKNVDKSLLQ